MFFILPFQHDRMSVRRLPWVSIAILALNVLFFLALHPAAKVQQQRAEEALERVYEYWGMHPVVEITGEFSEHFPRPVSGLRNLIGSTWEGPPPEEAARQQAEFEALIAEAVSAATGGPYGRWGYTPAAPSFITLLTSLFVHAGWLHLIGNMLFLYLSGPFIEDLWGRFFFPLFYLLGGAAATLAHALAYPTARFPSSGPRGPSRPSWGPS